MMADMDEPTATTASLEHNNNNSGNKQDNEDDPNGTGNGGGFVPPHEMAKELEEMVVNMVAKVDKVQDELTKKRKFSIYTNPERKWEKTNHEIYALYS